MAPGPTWVPMAPQWFRWADDRHALSRSLRCRKCISAAARRLTRCSPGKTAGKNQCRPSESAGSGSCCLAGARALPSSATSPSTTETTGLMESRLPAMATVLEILPPFLQIFQGIQKSDHSQDFFFMIQGLYDGVDICAGILHAQCIFTMAFSPTATFKLSTI